MLLASVYHNKDFLYYPQIDKDRAYSLNDIIKIAKNEGVILKGYKYINKEILFRGVTLPALLPIKVNEMLHMVLLTHIGRRKVKVKDPKLGIYKIKKEELFDIWNGEFLEIEGINGSNYKKKRIKAIPIKYTILSTFFQICSLFFLLCAMLFVDKTYPFYVPLSLFLCFGISEITYKRMLIMSMKKFDDGIIKNIFSTNRSKFKDKYYEMSNFKLLLISRPIQIINSVIILIAGFIILGFNGYLNIINIAIIITMRLILDVIENKVFNSRKRNIDGVERELLRSEHADNFISKLMEVQNQAYKRVAFNNFKKYCIAFLTGTICLLYCAFTGQININFIIFHAFIYFYLSEMSSKLLDMYYKLPDFRYSKCLYEYYCSE